jgi:hypothetical protein
MLSETSTSALPTPELSDSSGQPQLFFKRKAIVGFEHHEHVFPIDRSRDRERLHQFMLFVISGQIFLR